MVVSGQFVRDLNFKSFAYGLSAFGVGVLRHVYILLLLFVEKISDSPDKRHRNSMEPQQQTGWNETVTRIAATNGFLTFTLNQIGMINGKYRSRERWFCNRFLPENGVPSGASAVQAILTLVFICMV
jgi:hypothetical protein